MPSFQPALRHSLVVYDVLDQDLIFIIVFLILFYYPIFSLSHWVLLLQPIIKIWPD